MLLLWYTHRCLFPVPSSDPGEDCRGTFVLEFSPACRERSSYQWMLQTQLSSCGSAGEGPRASPHSVWALWTGSLCWPPVTRGSSQSSPGASTPLSGIQITPLSCVLLPNPSCLPSRLIWLCRFKSVWRLRPYSALSVHTPWILWLGGHENGLAYPKP